ncbi:MAG: hypothetical protein O7E57_15245 [Gammaproteobacteria bacterium]|nr:hypothetical protein [Gammaproteobacteria bacterium]
MNNTIAELIKEHLKNSSWQALANNIAAANRFRLEAYENKQLTVAQSKQAKQEQGKGKKGQQTKKTKPPKITLDRRKLQDLAKGKTNIPLTIYEMELLDTYFIRNGGPGLAELPVLRRQEDLFQVLGKADRVSFFIGARFVDSVKTEMIARWDVSALNAMRDRVGKDTATESYYVPTRNVGRPLEQKEWRSLRSQATGNVIVSIASPIANASTEYLLAEMFDIHAYRTRAVLPPVCFAHANDDSPSAFVREPVDVEGMNSDEAALLVNGQPHVSNNEGAEYGVVIGQRTAPDHAAFVVAGNTGPGTMAAAEFFATSQINETLPRYANSDKQPILVAIISTDVSSAVTDRRIDNRTVANTKMIGRSMVFEYSSRKWAVAGE